MAFQDTPTAGSDIKPVKMDKKELAEREAAAQAYAGETPEHFVLYCNDCIDTSVKAMLDIRLMQDECWRVFNEEEPDNWGTKELWQSRILYPKPNKLVRVGQAFARQAFDVDFLSIENERDEEAADFWTKFMGLMVARNFANFPTNFADATAMALAIGTSMEIIPQWISGQGLQLAMVNTENIHRDPSAASRQPWSGRYWIHQEWQPYYRLKKGQENGQYENIQDFSIGGGWVESPNLTQEEIARRKNMIYTQGAYNNNVMVSEFWGTVLSPKGEELLPRARYTCAGDQVIRKPAANPFESLRWPGVGFSALPNLRRFDGRGLIQGIRSLWYFANNLLSLHADNLNWIVNPMTEINTDAMVNPMDNDIYPGKLQLTYETRNGQSCVRTVDRNTRNNDIIAMLSKADMMIDDGGLIDRTIQGAPGYRSQVTKGEAAQNLEQSSTVMGSIAADIEDGALNAITAMAETVRANMTYDELRQWFPEYAEKYRSAGNPLGIELPKLTSGNFKIAGISAFMKHQDNLKNLNGLAPMFEPNSVFLPYLKPYPYLKAIVKYTNLVDTHILIDQDKADALDQQQQQQQEAAIQQQQQQQEIATQAQQAEAMKHGAQADKATAEAQANISQAGLFESQAGHQDVQAAMASMQPPAGPGTPGNGGPPEGAV